MSKHEPELFDVFYSTVRIRAGDKSNLNMYHTGTGFFYCSDDLDNRFVLVVSNKHVISNRSWIEIDFARRDASGKRVMGSPYTYRVPPHLLSVIEHPDENVDLAAILVGPILWHLKNMNVQIYTIVVSPGMSPPEEIARSLSATTSVLMVGFPNGLMDEFNNLPVVRRGILASPFLPNYQGKTDFVVDIAAFPGSSGSPVFAFLDAARSEGRGGFSIYPSASIYFLGVLYSGPTLNVPGKIVMEPVSTKPSSVQTSVMMHLGCCVKGRRVEEIIDMIKNSTM